MQLSHWYWFLLGLQLYFVNLNFLDSTIWGLSGLFIYQCIKCVHWPVRLTVHVYVCLCLVMASARLAAGISQSRGRTCCLSDRRVVIVILSASLRCFWETIPHINHPVWVSATGHSSLFSILSSLLVCSFFLLFILSFIHFEHRDHILIADSICSVR